MQVSEAFLNSSIGRKAVVAVTGTLLSLWLLAHMAGNLQVFLGPDAINSYGVALRKIPALLWFMRIGTLVIFVVHLVFAFRLVRENRAARPERYRHPNTLQATFASRTMIWTGLLIFTYTMYHLAHYTLGWAHPELFHVKDDMGRHDVYTMIITSFRNVYISVIYLAAMFVTAMHLSHGVQSVFQSLGWNNPVWMRRYKLTAWIFSALIFIGFSSIPVAVLAGLLKLPGEM